MTSFAVPKTIAKTWDGTIPNLLAADLRVLFFTGTSTALADCASTTLETLADIATLAEFTGAGYFRKAVENVALLLTEPSAGVFRHAIDFDNSTIPDVGGVDPPDDEIAGAIVYVHNDADDAQNWPLFVLDQEGAALSVTPDGRDLAFTVPAGGLFLAESDTN